MERWKRRKEDKWKGGKGERKKRRKEDKWKGGKGERKKSPEYYEQYPGDHLFYLLIYLLKCGGLQIHRNRRGANVSKY